jgi:hypothetical protein
VFAVRSDEVDMVVSGSPILAKLIYEGQEPFALLPPDRDASLLEKVRLIPSI